MQDRETLIKIPRNRYDEASINVQGVSQDLEIGCPNLMEISKQGVQFAHFQYFDMKVTDE